MNTPCDFEHFMHTAGACKRNTVSLCRREVTPLTVAAMSAQEPNKKRRVEDPLVRLSKEMSKMLRHNPPRGAMDSQGWIPLPVVLKHLRTKATEEDVRKVVDSNDKVRQSHGIWCMDGISISYGIKIIGHAPALRPCMSIMFATWPGGCLGMPMAPG